MTTILPDCNYLDKPNLIPLLQAVGAPTEGFSSHNEHSLGVAFLDLYVPRILPTLNPQQRTDLANELVGMCRAVTPYTYSWNPTKAEQRAQIQLELKSWDQIGVLLNKNNLVPSGYPYSLYLWELRHKSLIPEYFEWLKKTGAVLHSDSADCNNTWNLLLHQCANKEAVAGAQWLIDHQIWPTTQGFKPVHNPTAREDDTIFSWVCHSKGVALLKQIPPERLKAVMNHANGLGRTPLHHATANLIPEMVEFLLQLGADKSPQDNKGKYPLDLIRKTTSRVEHIASIQNMLGGTTTKTPQELLGDAIKKFDTTLLAQSLKDPTILAKKSDIIFDALSHGVGNSTPSVYKKMRQRKMEMFVALLDNTSLNYQNAQGDTLLHAAVKSGLLPAVQYLLENNPQLSQVRNNDGKCAADVTIEEFDKLTDFQNSVHSSYSDLTHEMQCDTSKKILKLYQKHHIDLQESNFPALLEDPKWQALLSKMRLEKALGENETAHKNKKKM